MSNESDDGSVTHRESYEMKLYPLDLEEYIATIQIEEEKNQNAIGQQEVAQNIQTVIILDRSGSMGDSARRVSNEIIPLFLSKLSYKISQVIHLVTFHSQTQIYSVTIERMKSLPITAAGGTNMSTAVKKCQTLFESFDTTKPIRLLTISDGQVGDRLETEKAATAFVEFLKTKNFSINSQAVRLFTSASQPDTTALCSLLQINNTATSQLADISTTESNELIADKMAELFQSDNLSKGKSLTTESEIIAKFPWESSTSSQLTLVPGENIFWLKDIPANGIKVGDVSVKVDMQPPLTLLKFQALMEGKLFYIIDHMKILKIVGTAEASYTVKRMVNYFECKENDLAQRSPLVKYLNIKSLHRKKISTMLSIIAEDDNVKTFDSAQKAEYLREMGNNNAQKSWMETASEYGIDIDELTRNEGYIIVFVMLLAIAIFKIINSLHEWVTGI